MKWILNLFFWVNSDDNAMCPIALGPWLSSDKTSGIIPLGLSSSFLGQFGLS